MGLPWIPESLLMGKLPPTRPPHGRLHMGDDSASAVLCTENSGLIFTVVLSDLPCLCLGVSGEKHPCRSKTRSLRQKTSLETAVVWS